MFRRLALVVLVVLGGFIFVAPAPAQNAIWSIDSAHSTARLFLASSRHPDDAVNVGVARATGLVIRNADDSAMPDFDFTIYPADKTTARDPLQQEQNNKEQGRDPDYTVINFKSTQVVRVDTEAFRVTGDLTLTYVERVVTLDPSEAYSGPVYGSAITHSVRQEAVFEFRQVSHSEVQGASEGTTEWSASGTISGGEFPELLNAVSTTNWPALVADEQCAMPSSVGEDYSGPTCTGKTVERASRTDLQCAMPSTVGEDYAGEVCTGTPLHVVAGRNAENRTSERGQGAGKTDELVADEVKIQLDLRLTSAVPIVVRAESR